MSALGKSKEDLSGDDSIDPLTLFTIHTLAVLLILAIESSLRTRQAYPQLELEILGLFKASEPMDNAIGRYSGSDFCA